MDISEELVAVADDTGQVTGAVPRSRMRRDNLWHHATGVIVRNRLGLVYVHRRTTSKDVFPGMYDCCAGGVMLAGETPEDAAGRELAEELGISGVKLTPVSAGTYADNVTRYHAHVFETTWDEPMRHQVAEVDWGGWMTLEELKDRLADPDWPFVPDTRLLVVDWLQARLTDQWPIPDGWDSRATLVERRWIDRVPRRAEVAAALRTEATLLPWLAPCLPLAVPVPSVIAEEPLRVRHVALPGSVSADLSAGMGIAMAEFLRALHAVPVSTAVALGVPDSATAVKSRNDSLARFAAEVVPLLPADRRDRARALVAAVKAHPAFALVHGDLGPEHLLVDSDVVTGVIDWSDAHIGDPAIDLAWTLFGAPAEFAQALAGAYGVDRGLSRRARRWHQLGPWHEVTYGIDTGQAAYVESGIRGVLSRLDRS